MAYLYTTSNRLSEANPTMVKTKSSHIASMYDDLYHKFFFTSLKFVNPWLFRHLLQGKISQLPISVLTLGKKHYL